MTGGTACEVRDRGDTEIVENVFLTQTLLGCWVHKVPGPVRRPMNLFGRFGMAGQTGLGHFGAGLKVLIQFLELAVICRGFRCEGGTAEGTHGN